MIHSSVKLITPAMAEEWLNKSGINRNLSKPAWKRFAAQMDAGEWELSPQGISFGEDGKLVDGQHRLRALIEHGKPIYMVVTTGVSQSAVKALDCGRIRNSRDRAAILGFGESLGRRGADVISCLLNAFVRGSSRPVTPATQEKFSVLYENSIVFALGALPATRRLTPSMVIGILAKAHHSGIDPSELERWAFLYIKGEGHTDNERAAFLAHQYMLSGMRQHSGSVSRLQIAGIISASIVKFLARTEVKLLRPASSDPWPLKEWRWESGKVVWGDDESIVQLDGVKPCLM